jgi:hypothetical protein
MRQNRHSISSSALRQQRLWHSDSERLRGLKIEDKLNQWDWANDAAHALALMPSQPRRFPPKDKDKP